MSFAVADRVKETTSTTGTTSPLQLAGAVSQFQPFINLGSGNQCNYCAMSGDGINWEAGIGTVTSGTPNTLSRDTVLASSNVVGGVPQKISLVSPTTVFLNEPAASLSSRICAPIVPPPKAANWTHRNFSAATTITDVANGLALADASTAAIGNSLSGVSIAAPSTPYNLDFNLSTLGLVTTGGAGVQPVIGWTDGTKVQILIFVHVVANAAPFIIQYEAEAVYNFSAFGTYNSTAQTQLSTVPNLWDYWPRLSDNGTNVTFSISADGVSFLPVYTVAKASGYLGSSGYTNIFFGHNQTYLGNGGAVNTTMRSMWQH